MSEANPNSRLEAFCDGVFAIALTLLIIEIKIPSTDRIQSVVDFWRSLRYLAPSIFAFVLSFTVIFITWVNHHATLKLVNKSSPSFVYANGFLLLTVVFIPFPTALMGEYLFTDHSTPAVVLYNSVLVFQAIGWILITAAALNNKLTGNEESALQLNQSQRYGYFAVAIYSLCALSAFWIPLASAIVTTLIWMIWLMRSLTMKHA